MKKPIEQGSVGSHPGALDFLRCHGCDTGFFRNVHSRDNVSCPHCGTIRKYGPDNVNKTEAIEKGYAHSFPPLHEEEN